MRTRYWFRFMKMAASVSRMIVEPSLVGVKPVWWKCCCVRWSFSSSCSPTQFTLHYQLTCCHLATQQHIDHSLAVSSLSRSLITRTVPRITGASLRWGNELLQHTVCRVTDALITDNCSGVCMYDVCVGIHTYCRNRRCCPIFVHFWRLFLFFQHRARETVAFSATRCSGFHCSQSMTSPQLRPQPCWLQGVGTMQDRVYLAKMRCETLTIWSIRYDTIR